jgi:hypothetical protein
MRRRESGERYRKLCAVLRGQAKCRMRQNPMYHAWSYLPATHHRTYAETFPVHDVPKSRAFAGFPRLLWTISSISVKQRYLIGWRFRISQPGSEGVFNCQQFNVHCANDRVLSLSRETWNSTDFVREGHIKGWLKESCEEPKILIADLPPDQRNQDDSKGRTH